MRPEGHFQFHCLQEAEALCTPYCRRSNFSATVGPKYIARFLSVALVDQLWQAAWPLPNCQYYNYCHD
jgi:hypothetical protein